MNIFRVENYLCGIIFFYFVIFGENIRFDYHTEEVGFLIFGKDYHSSGNSSETGSKFNSWKNFMVKQYSEVEFCPNVKIVQSPKRLKLFVKH